MSIIVSNAPIEQYLLKSDASIIIGLVGMPASGKTEAACILKEMLGFEFFRLSLVVREELRLRNLKETYANLEEVASELRYKYGDDIIIRRATDKLRALRFDRCCIDGIRSISEVNVLRKEFPSIVLIAIHSSPKIRLVRSAKVSIISREEFEWRDNQNLKLGIGDVIALADFVVNHEHNSRYRYKMDLYNLVKKIANINIITPTSRGL